MKKRYKYALIFLFIHLFIHLIWTNPLKSTSGGIGGLFFVIGMFAIPYESPLFFIGDHPYLRPFLSSDKGHFIFWYLFGSLFYLSIGFIIGYLRELPNKNNK